MRVAPGAPTAVRLLKGHPFAASCQEEGAKEQPQQMSLTQLAPEQQLVPAEVLSGEQLPAFKVGRCAGWGRI